MKMNSVKKTISIFVCLLFMATTALADVVLLKSGREISGEILEQTDEFVKVNFKGVDLTFYMDEVDLVNGEEPVLENAEAEEAEMVVEETVEWSELEINDMCEAFWPGETATYDQVREAYGDSSAEERKDLADAIKGLRQDQDLVFKTIAAKNEKALRLFRQAVHQKGNGYLLGRPQEGEIISLETPLPRFFFGLQLSKVLLLEAKILNDSNNRRKSFCNLRSVIKFNQHFFEQKYGSMLGFIVGAILWKEFLKEKVVEAVLSEEIDKGAVRYLLYDLIALCEKFTPLDKALKEDYEKLTLGTLKATKQALVDEGEEKGGEVFWNKNYAYYEEKIVPFFKEIFLLVKQNDPARIEKIMKEAHTKAKIDAGLSMVAFLIGNKNSNLAKQMFAGITATGPVLRKTLNYYYSIQSSIEGTKALAVIKLYLLENGKLPSSWEELSKYDAELPPKDPFNEFKFFKSSFGEDKIIFYSIGPDRKDQSGLVDAPLHEERGEGEEYFPPQGDIVFEITR